MLRDFRPEDVVLAAPACDAAIPGEAQRVAGFFVAPETGEAVLGVELIEHVGQATRAAGEASASRAQADIEFGQRLVDEDEVGRIKVVRVNNLRLVDVQNNHRPAGANRPEERSVVLHPQVLLQPDDLQGGRHS